MGENGRGLKEVLEGRRDAAPELQAAEAIPAVMRIVADLEAKYREIVFDSIRKLLDAASNKPGGFGL